jgi:hypothetical protein
MNQAGPSREHEGHASIVGIGATHQRAVSGLVRESPKHGGSARHEGHHFHDHREQRRESRESIEKEEVV